jgi:hypothetical protein
VVKARNLERGSDNGRAAGIFLRFNSSNIEPPMARWKLSARAAYQSASKSFFGENAFL